MNTSITSPDYPTLYLASTKCVWLITATDGWFPSLTFTDIAIQRGIDWLYIERDDIVVMLLSGSNLHVPDVLVVNGTSLKVTFQAFKWFSNLRGFSFLLELVEQNGEVQYSF